MIGLPIEDDLARCLLSAPKIARATSVRPDPTRPQSPTISPSRTIRSISADAGRRRQTFDLEQDLAGHLREIPRIAHVDGAADHHAHQFVRRGVPWTDLADPAAVTQHGDTVAVAQNFGHAVRDVDDRHAVGLQPAISANRSSVSRSDSAAVGSSITRMRAFWLTRLGDLDHLLLRDAESLPPSPRDRYRSR